MNRSRGVDNSELVAAGVDLMRQNGMPIAKIPSRGRSMIYQLETGETVRIRTCNIHVLNVNEDEVGKLNIEGTDKLLIVMPETEWTPGNVIAYLVPSEKAANDARQSHEAWLATHPNTGGNNKAFNIWFDKGGPKTSNDFATRWGKYRLSGAGPAQPDPDSESGRIKTEVEAARQRISKVAGVKPNAVKITIYFSL